MNVATASASLSADVAIALAGQPRISLADLAGSATIIASPSSTPSLDFDSTHDTVGNQHISLAWPNINHLTATTNLAGADPSLGYLSQTTSKNNAASSVSDAGGILAQADLPLDPALQAKLKDIAGAVQNAINGIDKFHDFVFDRVLNHTIPLAGTKLKDAKDTADDILNQVKARANDAFTFLNGLSTVTADNVRTAFTTRLAQWPERIAHHRRVSVGSRSTLSIPTATAPPTPRVRQPDLHGTPLNKNYHPNFDIGLPSLGMAMTGRDQHRRGYDFHLKSASTRTAFMSAPHPPPIPSLPSVTSRFQTCPSPATCLPAADGDRRQFTLPRRFRLDF